MDSRKVSRARDKLKGTGKWQINYLCPFTFLNDHSLGNVNKINTCPLPVPSNERPLFPFFHPKKGCKIHCFIVKWKND